MRALRSHLAAIAVAALTTCLGMVALSALGACQGSEHAHGGIVADDCPMHHAPEPTGQHGHHGHGALVHEHEHEHDHDGHDTQQPPAQDERLACGCSHEVTGPYAGPAGVLVPYVSLAPAMPLSAVVDSRAPRPAAMPFPPLSPPPRTDFSRS